MRIYSLQVILILLTINSLFAFFKLATWTYPEKSIDNEYAIMGRFTREEKERQIQC